jgi:hypothetical protein
MSHQIAMPEPCFSAANRAAERRQILAHRAAVGMRGKERLSAGGAALPRLNASVSVQYLLADAEHWAVNSDAELPFQ